MLDPYPFQLFPNPRSGTPGIVVLPDAGFRRAKAEITTWPGYAPTPLRRPAGDRRATPVSRAVRLKDEASRFGLGSFKALGGAYAVADAVRRTRAARHRRAPRPRRPGRRPLSRRRPDITVTCATDGNHGRAVAWGAQRFGCRCVIFVHATVSPGRVDAIAEYGAEVRRVPGTYDDAVREAARQAAAEGLVRRLRHLLARLYRSAARRDAGLPADGRRGGSTSGTAPPPTHVFVQGGVGGVAAAVSVQMRARFDPPPALIVVEPDRAACLLASAEVGAADRDCPAISTRSWRGWPAASRACWRGRSWNLPPRPSWRCPTKRRSPACDCWRRKESRRQIGVAGLAALLLAAADPAAREALGLTRRSRVLLFGTEGATDPES